MRLLRLSIIWGYSFAAVALVLLILFLAVVCFGLITHAESALLAHEAEQRRVDSRLRRDARIDLAKRGLVGTETEIAKWIEERKAQSQLQARTSQGPSNPPTETPTQSS